jgi:tRNA threonylcarbamoyladenosine biosynthesis protein TsaB
MRLLAIDTTGPGCAVALRRPGHADVFVRETMARGQAERLAPMVEEVLARAGLAPRDLDRIGVCTGPGSFAGSRIGVAFARGLALATGAECVGISRLAWTVADAGIAGKALAVHDARRGDVVVQAFDGGKALAAPRTMAVEAVQAAIRDGRLTGALLGSGARLIKSAATGVRDGEPELGALLDLTGRATAPFDPPKPFYARPPDANLPGGT